MPINNNSSSKSSGSSSSNKKAKTSNNRNMNSGGGDTEEMKKMSEEFRIVRDYILACPHVSSLNNSNHQHPAIKAALHGLDQELKRMERDAKLQRKFSTESSSFLSAGSNNHNAAAADVMEAAVMVANPSSMTTTTTTTTSTTENWSTAATNQDDEDDDDQADDWQDLAADQSDDVIMESSDFDINNNKHAAAAATTADCNSFLGDRLSAEVIKTIAQQHSVTVQTPLAAIAVALHAAMRSTALGFACTGIPEDEKIMASGGGFAPPVRELPATQLLPPNWEKTQQKSNGSVNDSIIALRYRKKGTGSVVLQVSSSTSNNNNNSSSNNNNNNNPTMVHVTLVPSATAPEPPSESLSFALADHVNLDSFARASSSSNSRQGVPPALHYKALSSLLTKFCTTFDLGGVHGDGDSGDYSSTNMPYVDTSIQHYPAIVPTTMKQPQQQPPTFVKQQFPDEPPPPQFEYMVGNPRDPRLYPPTIESAFPGLRDPSRNGGRGGDFAMDKGLPGMGAGVLPGGGGGPGGGFLGDPMQGGNLMGPNHPLFTGAGVGGAPANYLVPRYDPVFGPPGGPGDVQEDPNNPFNNNNSRLPRPRGDVKPNFNGNPNPDHLPPPGGCGHDMFS